MSSQKTHFKPAKHSSNTSRYVPRYSGNYSSDLSQFKDEIVTKGGNEVVKIELDKLESNLTDLRNNSQFALKNLESNPTLRDEFRQIVANVNLLYDTDYYPVLQDMVKRKFGDLNDVVPGTVGAYFIGCLGENNHGNIPPSCLPVCVGSMPPSKQYASENNWSFCDTTVVWAILEDNKYKFTTLNHVPTSDKALIFIDQGSPANFLGFDDDEKEQLSEIAKQFRIIGYSKEGEHYVDIIDWTPLSNIKSRISVLPTTEPSRLIPFAQQDFVQSRAVNPQSTSNTALILLIVIVILVILFFMWKISSDSNKSQQIF